MLGLSDSLSSGQYIDGAILTVLRDHSGVRSIHQASELLKSLGIRLIGCVVNGMPFKADRRITWFQVESENMESIHNHNAYATVIGGAART